MYPNVLTPLEAGEGAGSEEARGPDGTNTWLLWLVCKWAFVLPSYGHRHFGNAVEFVHLTVTQIPPKCESIRHSIIGLKVCKRNEIN